MIGGGPASHRLLSWSLRFLVGVRERNWVSQSRCNIEFLTIGMALKVKAINVSESSNVNLTTAISGDSKIKT